MTHPLFHAPFHKDMVRDLKEPVFAELFKDCPDELKDPENPWNKFAANLRLSKGLVDHRVWKYKNNTLAIHQFGHIGFILLAAFGVDSRKVDAMQDAVLAWMFSEMLSELPEFVPLKKSG